ncbi:MAG TPA: beta-propeller fold lactonase family protein [Solirubrobacterales bacterium]|nr:beta-propeller fold lactonase family protein [Solirubrobacterales bacterium]
MAATALGLALLVAAAAALAADKGELSFQERVAEFDIHGATTLEISPDGKHLYATGSGFPGTVTALELSTSGDDYTFVETETDGLDDAGDAGGEVDGIRAAEGLAISPDGKHVYVAGASNESTIAFFERDATSGELSFAGTQTATGLSSPDDVAVSPDGDHVYTISGNNDKLFGFKRNPSDGTLTDTGIVAEDGVGGVDMADPQTLTVAPDGEALYVGTDGGDSLAAFSRTAADGTLTYVETETDGVDGGGPGGTVNGLNGVRDVLVSADDEYVYASGRNDDAVAVFERDGTSEELDFIEVEENGVDDGGPGGPVSGLDAPERMALSTEPDQRNLYIAGHNSDSIAVFRRNDTTGKLNFVESESDGVDDAGDAGSTAMGLDGSAAVAVADDNTYVYGVADLEGGASVFDLGAAPGALSFVRAKPAFYFDSPSGLAISPDGKHLVALTEDIEALHSFDRNATTGLPSLLDSEFEGIDDPSDAGGAPEGLYESSSVHFSPDGKFVYVTAYSAYSVAVFSFDGTTGELSWIETEKDDTDSGDGGGTVDGLYEPHDLAFSPSGSSVYVPGDSEDAIAAFSRDLTTGKLVFAEAEFDGAGAVDGLEGAQTVDVSPDGKHVYVGSTGDEAIALFSRNGGTSELTFLDVFQSDSKGGSVVGLGAVEALAVSPDGKQVYATGDQMLWRFDRNAATGSLTLAETEEDDVDDPSDGGGTVDGLDGPTELALSADGEEVYAGGGYSPGEIATFSRDKGTGALSFLDAEEDGIDDPGDAGPAVQGLDGVTALAVSPDDRFLYASAERKNAIVIFTREDDFLPPETTIDSGPAEGEVTKDSTPSFTYSSNEAGSSFECSTDGGAYGPCASPLPELADGDHSFAVQATDSAGNTDPTPAARNFTVDTKVSNGKIKAKKKQKIKAKKNKIQVKIKLTAGEAAEGLGKGKIKIGKKSYKLKKKTKDLKADKTKKIKLKPKKNKHKKKIAKKLKKGKKVTAKITGKITDEAGNKKKKDKSVKLKRK